MLKKLIEISTVFSNNQYNIYAQELITNSIR